MRTQAFNLGPEFGGMPTFPILRV